MKWVLLSLSRPFLSRAFPSVPLPLTCVCADVTASFIFPDNVSKRSVVFIFLEILCRDTLGPIIG